MAQQIKLDALLQRAQNQLKRKAYIFVQNGETESVSLYRRGIRQISKSDRTIQMTTVEDIKLS